MTQSPGCDKGVCLSKDKLSWRPKRMETALSVTVLLMLCPRPCTVIESLLQSLALEYFSITQDHSASSNSSRPRQGRYRSTWRWTCDSQFYSEKGQKALESYSELLTEDVATVCHGHWASLHRGHKRMTMLKVTALLMSSLSLILQRFVVWLANRRTFHGCLQQTGCKTARQPSDVWMVHSVRM